MALNPRQARFVDEYLVDLNATQAAIRAGYSAKGTRVQGARVQGTRLLANDNVAAAIAVRQGKRTERTELTADYVLAGILATVRECQGAEHRNPQAALKGLELLGRHLAMFTDKTINKHLVEELTDSEITDKLAEYDNRTSTSRATH